MDSHGVRSCFRSRNVCADDANTVFDDILIATEDLCCRIHCLRQVLSKLQRFGLTARPSKLYAGFQELQFLGHTVGKDMIKPEEKKISKILNFGRPTTKKQVRGVIGLLRRYVPDFSTLVCPLTELTKKGMPNKVVWADRCQEALVKVQAVLSSDAVLKLADL